MSASVTRCVVSLVLAALGAVAAAATGQAAQPGGCGLAGAFREYSAYIGYKAGGGGAGPTSTRQLVLSGDEWRFGSSSGTFRTAPITAADWHRWGTNPYGPTTKIVLSGWNGGTADGEVEAEGSAVDFFWVIYDVPKSRFNPAATVKLKFGHVTPPHGCAGATTGSSRTPTVAVTPGRISAGRTIHVAATGFQPNERVAMTETYTLNGRRQTSILGDEPADSTGAVRFDHDTFPGTTPAGAHAICGVGSYSKARACGTFTVTAGSGSGPASPTVPGTTTPGVPVAPTPGVPKVG